MLSSVELAALCNELVKISTIKSAGDVTRFSRPLSKKVKDVAGRLTSKGPPARVIRPNFADPEAARAALKKSTQRAARAAHNKKVLGRMGLGGNESDLLELRERLNRHRQANREWLTSPEVLIPAAVSGATLGGSFMTDPTSIKRRLEKKRKKGEPISPLETFEAEHPGLVGVGLGAAAAPLGLVGARYAGPPGLLGGFLLPSAALTTAKVFTKKKNSG